MRRARWHRRRSLLLGLVAVIAAGLGIVSHAAGLLHRTELQTIDARFSIRGSRPQLVKNLLVVGIDDSTFSHFNNQGVKDQWPFPRRDHARVIDNLVKAGAKEIAFDVQFTEPSDNTDDDDLAEAIWHAGHMVLATTSVGAHGSTDILGGNANLWRFGKSIPGNATVIPDSDGSLRRMQYEYQGLETFGVAVAGEATGKPISSKLFGGPTRRSRSISPVRPARSPTCPTGRCTTTTFRRRW